MTSRRRALSTLLAAVVVAMLAVAAPGLAQDLPAPTTPPPSDQTTTTTTTSTTAPTSTTASTAPTSTTTTTRGGLLEPGSSSTTTTTTQPGEADDGGIFDDSTEAPEGAGSGEDADGEAEGPATTPRTVPAEAQRIINAYPRTAASNNAALVAGVEELVDLGLTRDEAVRVGFGRFPIGGPANYSHDWLYPRFGPGFRFHLGTDVFATYGTPLRSPADGTVESGVGSLGGLYLKIFMEDGTYFYYAHLSALTDDFVDGMTVKTGDVVGYVGDSGNAKGGQPHLHIGVYPQGGSAVDPKPILDQFLADALEQLPAVIESVRSQRAVSGPRTATAIARSAPVDPMLETALLRAFTTRVVDRTLSTEALFAATNSPSAASTSFLDAEADQVVNAIDWQARAARTANAEALESRVDALVQVAFDAFMGGDGSGATVLAVASGG